MRGQMPSRAVPAYNALHRVCGPDRPRPARGASASCRPALLVGALVWGFHIFLDRALGYGLRTPDGFQRA